MMMMMRGRRLRDGEDTTGSESDVEASEGGGFGEAVRETERRIISTEIRASASFETQWRECARS